MMKTKHYLVHRLPSSKLADRKHNIFQEKEKLSVIFFGQRPLVAFFELAITADGEYSEYGLGKANAAQVNELDE